MGDFAIFDSTRPYSADLKAGFQHLVLKIPRNELIRRIGTVEAYTAQKVSSINGIGAIASQFVRSLPPQILDMNNTSVGHVAENCIDLLTAACVNTISTSSSPTYTRGMHLSRAKAFIRSINLTPKLVAKELGISERYLASFFAEDGISTSRYIWKVRVERCKTTLSEVKQNQ